MKETPSELDDCFDEEDYDDCDDDDADCYCE